MMFFDESKHPRDEDGKFTEKGGSSHSEDKIPSMKKVDLKDFINYDEDYLTSSGGSGRIKDVKSSVLNFGKTHKIPVGGGTFNARTGEPVSHPKGFQVSFVRDEAYDKLSDDGWDRITEHLAKDSGHEHEIGAWDGGAEVSFWYDSKEKALEIAEMFNQVEILDWEALNRGDKKIYVPNEKFIADKEVDYDGIIKEIL